MATFSDDDVRAQIAACKRLFTEHFGGQCSHVVSAPGRVNLIGEHTGAGRPGRGPPVAPCARTSHQVRAWCADYNEGFVMPFCIQRCTVLAARNISGTTCRVVSVNEG